VEQCIVTGGSGFVGNGLVRRLLAAGHPVTIFDLVEPADSELEGEVEFVGGDVRDQGALCRAARGAQLFFHIAAMVPLTRAGAGFREVNVGGVENAVEAALRGGAEHFVHLSSSAIYGIPRLFPIREDTPPTPLGTYGHAKLEGERVAQHARERGLRVAVIRPRTVIGPGRLGIFDLLFDWIQHGSPIFTLGRLDKPFQLLSNRDMAEVTYLASRARADGEYNVGAERYGTLREDLNALAERAGSPSRVVGIPAWFARPILQALDWFRLSPLVDWHYKTIDKEFWYDNERPKRELGWQPRDSNIEMLWEAYRWYVENAAASGRATRSPHRSPLARGLLRLLARRRA
jgi:nucleoside-diphosphate-sugar epimerase